MGEPKTSQWLWISLKIGALSFGSASRVVLYEDEMVTERGWLTAAAFREALTLAQILPGPNLINLAACLGLQLFSVPVTLLGILLLALPGALLAILVILWVPLNNPVVATVFHGFAIGALMLLGRLLWGLLTGIGSAPESARLYKVRGRYLLAAGFAAAALAQTPILPLIFGGVVVGLAWEFGGVIHLQIYWVFLRISLISFGGVFGVLPELQRLVVDEHHWLTAQQFIQDYVVGQFVPGPNMSMCALVGYQVAGWGGAVAAFLGIYSGPVAVVGVVTTLYYRNRAKSWVRRTEIGLRPLVFALIFSSSALFLKQQLGTDWLGGLVVGLPIAIAHWTRKLGAISCVFAAGGLWWAYVTVTAH